MRSFVMAAALVALVSTPVFAQSRVHADRTVPYARSATYPPDAYGAVTPYGTFGAGIGGDRDQALRQCSALEQKTSPTIRDSNLSMYEFRACMNQHGQAE